MARDIPERATKIFWNKTRQRAVSVILSAAANFLAQKNRRGPRKRELIS
jgi:hypothetical protein